MLDFAEHLFLHSCCFTGNRVEKLPKNKNELEVIHKRLSIFISKSIENGYRIFFNGGCTGIDIIAAEIVQDIREKLKGQGFNIYLITVVPYRGQADKWSSEWQTRYKNVLDFSNDIIYLHENKNSTAFMDRNKYMVNASNLVIAVHNGGTGGTKNTLDYATGLKRHIIKIPTSSGDSPSTNIKGWGNLNFA